MPISIRQQNNKTDFTQCYLLRFTLSGQNNSKIRKRKCIIIIIC